MESHRKRYTGVLVVTLSLIVATALTALFYYFKIEKNETYQNQLHFRELQRYGTLLTQSVDSLTIGVKSTRNDARVSEAPKLILKLLELEAKKSERKVLEGGIKLKHEELMAARRDLKSVTDKILKSQEEFIKLKEGNLKKIADNHDALGGEFYSELKKYLNDENFNFSGRDIDIASLNALKNAVSYLTEKLYQWQAGDAESENYQSVSAGQNAKVVINEVVTSYKDYVESNNFANFTSLAMQRDKLVIEVKLLEDEFFNLANNWRALDYYISDQELSIENLESEKREGKDILGGFEKEIGIIKICIFGFPKENEGIDALWRCITDKFESAKLDITPFITIKNCLTGDGYNRGGSMGVESCISSSGKVADSLQKIKFPNLVLILPDDVCAENCDSRISLYNDKASLFVIDKTLGNSKSHYGMIVPLEDFFQASPLVPLIMLTDNAGQRLFRAENLTLGARHQGLRFENLSEVVKGATASVGDSSNQPVQTQQVQLNTAMINQSGAAEKTGTNSKSLNLLHSRYFDTELAGEPYRIFVTPWSHPQINNGEVFYLFGVQARNVLMLNKLLVSTSTVLILMLLVVILVALLPLLKIRLVGYSQTFSRADTHTLMLGFIVLLTALSLALFHFLHYSGIKHQLNEIAKAAANQMQMSFEAELTSWDSLADELIEKENKPARFIGDCLFSQRLITIERDAEKIGEDNCQKGQSITPPGYWPEGVAKLYLELTDGKPYFTEKAFWSSKKQFSLSRANNPLTGRSYVNDAFSCKQIEGVAYKSCDENIYIEQVLNRRDLRLNTWIGKPIFKDASAQAEDKQIMIVGGQLLTFTQPVMPRYFQFLVFDNHSGEVLMHSDSRYSKIDNIYVDTDNNNLLKALVRQGNIQPEIFNAVYKGKDYRFAVSRLKENVPWTLVVMYDKAPFRMLNMSAAFFAFSASVLLISMLYLVVRVLPQGCRLVTAIIWPHKKRSSSDKFNVGRYIVVRFTIIVITVTAVTSLLGYYSADYLTNQYNALNRQYVGSRLAAQDSEVKKLSRTIYDGIQGGNLPLSVPCFGFNAVGASWSIACDSRKIIKSSNLKPEPAKADKSFINYIWQNLSLDMPFLNEFWALAAVSWEASAGREAKKGGKITQGAFDTFGSPGTLIKNGLNGVLFAALVAVSFTILLLLYLVLRYWVWRRLMGLDQPPNFRINPNTLPAPSNTGYQLYHAIARIMSGYKSLNNECFYVQLIRPAAAMQAVLSGKVNEKDEALLQAAGLAGLTLHSVHQIREWEAVKVAKESSGDKRTLALSGFETLALEKEKRLKALALLQRLKQQGEINLILVVEIAPLYRLTHPEAYPVPLKDEDKPDEAEILAWSELLRDFVKLYDWVPCVREYKPKNNALDVLLYEANSWPELKRVAVEFFVYHFAVKHRNTYLQRDDKGCFRLISKKGDVDEAIRQSHFKSCMELLDALTKIDVDNSLMNSVDNKNDDALSVIDSINLNWSANQVIDFFGTAAGAHYRYRWELCTTQERLLMINIANEHLPNPRNYIPLDHLVRRGFIYRDKGWHLVNHSFQKFVRTAEERELVRTWIGEASESIWKYTRFPLLVLLFLLLAGLAYTATEAFQSFFGIFSAVLGAIPLVLRIFSFTRSGSLE